MKKIMYNPNNVRRGDIVRVYHKENPQTFFAKIVSMYLDQKNKKTIVFLEHKSKGKIAFGDASDCYPIRDDIRPSLYNILR